MCLGIRQEYAGFYTRDARSRPRAICHLVRFSNNVFFRGTGNNEHEEYEYDYELGSLVLRSRTDSRANYDWVGCSAYIFVGVSRLGASLRQFRILSLGYWIFRVKRVKQKCEAWEKCKSVVSIAIYILVFSFVLALIPSHLSYGRF